MFMQIIVALSWLALPVGLVCLIDDWFLRPRRQIAALPQPARDLRNHDTNYYFSIV